MTTIQAQGYGVVLTEKLVPQIRWSFPGSALMYELSL